MRLPWLLVLLAGCGRWSFDESTSAGDAGRGDGSTDGRVADAAGDGVLATTCGTSGAMACDGFEGNAFDPMWTLDTSAGSVTLDSTRAYRGATSAHVHIDQITSATTDPRATLHGPAGLSTPVTGIIYVRAWIYVASPMYSTTYLNQMLNLANTAGTGISMGARNGVAVNNDYTSSLYAEATMTFPLDRWVCIQFQIPSNMGGTSRVFLDGTELTDVALTKATAQPPPDHIYVGIEWVGNPASMPAADAWVDELVVDTQPTTCAQ